MKKIIFSLLLAVFAGGLSNTLTAGQIYTIDSPIWGTYYESSAPGYNPPLVRLGYPVIPGYIVCYIEAMQLMCGIESPISGTIISIQCSNFQSVEPGQTLFVLSPF